MQSHTYAIQASHLTEKQYGLEFIVQFLTLGILSLQNQLVPNFPFPCKAKNYLYYDLINTIKHCIHKATQFQQ